MIRWRAREARPAGWPYNLAKTMMHTVLFWVVFLAILPHGIVLLEEELGLSHLRFDHVGVRGTGWVLFTMGGILGISSSLYMVFLGQGTPLPTDAARRLVVAGPYRYLRNPMAVAGLSQGFAVGLILGSPGVILYAVLAVPLWQFLVRPVEEEDLYERFGEPYAAYRRAVRCWIPRFTAYRQGERAPPKGPAIGMGGAGSLFMDSVV